VFAVVMMINQKLLFLKQNYFLQSIIFICFQLLFILSTGRGPFLTKHKKKIIRISAYILGLSAIYIIYSIVLVPFEMYVYWIKLIQEGSQGGAISKLFVWAHIFFICLFSGLSYHKKYLVSILGILLSQCILFSILYHNIFLYCTTTLVIVITSLLIFLINKKDDSKVDTYFYYLIRIAAILILSFLLSLFVPLYGGWLGEMSLYPDLHNFLSKDFPVSPIISTVGDIDGPVSKSDFFYNNFNKQPVFKIRGKNDIPHYIRISAYGSYNNNSWYNSYNELKVKDDGIINFNQIPDNPDIEILLLADYYIQIPHTLNTERINITESNIRNFQFASFDHGFKFDLPLTGSKKILLKEHAEKSPELTELSGEEKKEYLNVPRYIEDSISAILDFYNLRHKTENEKIRAILEFLRENHVYSINTSLTNSRDDRVIQFLKVKKRGFCQHFSSAFIFMARLCGIPSRFVTGYYGIIPGDAESAVLTGQSAHAWAEVWIPETGWRTIEATPPFSLGRPEQMVLISQLKDNSTRNQLIDILQIQNTQKKENNDFLGYCVKIGVFSVFLLIAIGLTIASGKKIKQWRLVKSRENKIIKIYKSIIQKSGKIAVPGPEILGWKKWAQSFGAKRNLSNSEVQQLIHIAYSCFFTAKQTQQEDVDRLKKIRKKIYVKRD
jgi:hypothetical protein